VSLVFCVDFGSTFTKVALVDVDAGVLVGTTSVPTTARTDILDGWLAARDELRAVTGSGEVPVLACSSAGGGLLIAVVGNEELVTAEAGKRVALSSGGRVVHVSSGRVDIDALTASAPDVVLLVGGTDGGNAEVLLGNAAALAGARWAGPVVVAGNADAADEVDAVLTKAGVPVEMAANVVPQIGVLQPDGARAAIREMFLAHVIGGKHLSGHAEFTAMVRGATPDVVLDAVELLAHGLDDAHPGAGDVVVVDVGGATTDVHSVVELEPEEAGLSREVVAAVPVTRTVEGDLGMRWSAVPTVQAAREAGLSVSSGLEAAAETRRKDTAMVPATAAEVADDLAIASAAVALAVRRHAGRQRVVFDSAGRLVERSGKDLRQTGLLVGSGGVLRHSEPAAARQVLASASHSGEGEGWLVPREPRVVIDRDYRLAPAGLLLAEHPAAAYGLLTDLIG
jgi:uncharacterized protein (TIGR01319 family)